jgi:hypothetical protein
VLLASQRARWEHEQSTLAQFTVSESFTLGWLNVMLRHLWPTVIEKEVAEVAAANIRVRGRPVLYVHGCLPSVSTSVRDICKHIKELLSLPQWQNAHNVHAKGSQTRSWQVYSCLPATFLHDARRCDMRRIPAAPQG